MRYSDIKDNPKSYITEIMRNDEAFRCHLLRCLNAIAGELDSISYRMKKTRKKTLRRPKGLGGQEVRRESRSKSSR